MKLRIGDLVQVIAGKDKGKQGKVAKIYETRDRVVVEGVNMAKKHMKPRNGMPGQIVEVEAPIHVSNVMYFDAKKKGVTRVGFVRSKDGVKQRVSKKSGETLSHVMKK